MNLLKQYEWILFDADETLFQFDAFSGLKLMFSRFAINFTEDDYYEYQALNVSLWTAYQNNQITIQALKCQRFDVWSKKLNLPADYLNNVFISVMVEICMPIEGAVNLLKSLHGKVRLGIVTNGFVELQQERLERTGLQHHFEFVVTSEEVGIAKPHAGIFDYTLSIMGHPARDRVLMVGDNPDSDILGGMNAELHTCWLNMHNRTLPPYITPNYQVASLYELEWRLCNFHHVEA